jgi:LPXTG-site transpeptidase (sortase) family protein
MARPRRPAPRRRGGAIHSVAGFVLGLMAVATGLAFAAPPGQDAPVSEAAERAATTAAVRMALGTPDVPREAAPVQVQSLVPESERELLMRPKSATRIVVAAVGIDASVSSVGYTYRDGRLEFDVPRREAGHYVGTAAPGETGNLVISGHVTNRGGMAVFAPLPGVRAGDVVEVYRGDQVFRYSITEIRVVAADATDVMSQTHDATLTLITCFPERNYQHRLVVIGKLI